MSRVSLEAVETALIQSAQAIPELIAHPLDAAYKTDEQLGYSAAQFSAVLSEETERRLTPAQHTSSESTDQIRLMGLMEDGLHVTVYGIAQVIRQARQQENPLASIHAAAFGAHSVFEDIAKLPLDAAVPLEESFGFRELYFYNPRRLLRVYGSSVTLPIQSKVDTTSRIDQGCPFRKNLMRAYPTIASSFLTFVGVQPHQESMR